MVEIHPNIHVGDEEDYYSIANKSDGWAVVHACKDPFHRKALGYTGRAASKEHPEYLVARRGDRLMLNIIDVSNPAFFATKMIYAAMDFIDEALSKGRKVLIHCNQGESRGPSLALLYMAARLDVLTKDSYELAEQSFREMYPRFKPGRGIREHLKQNWVDYCGK